MHSSTARLTSKLTVIEDQLQRAYSKRYPVCRVYVTFEREEHQRACMKELTHGWVDEFLKCGLYRFRDTLLKLEEPVEPQNVR